MEYVNMVIDTLKKATVFTGRSRRKEFWVLFVALAIGSVAASILGLIPVLGLIITWLWNIAALLASIAVSIRRMHDVNKSGWYMLIPIYNIVLAVTEGDKGPNQYGEDPKAGAAS